MFQFTIKTPYEDLYSGERSSNSLSLEDGDVEIFEHHADLTGTLQFSPIVITTDGDTEEFLARSGVFLFDNENNRATLLANYCQKKAEVTHQTVQEYADFIQKQLEEGKDLSAFQIQFLEGEKLAVQEQIKEME